MNYKCGSNNSIGGAHKYGEPIFYETVPTSDGKTKILNCLINKCEHCGASAVVGSCSSNEGKKLPVVNKAEEAAKRRTAGLEWEGFFFEQQHPFLLDE